MAPHSPPHSSKITVTADERDRVLRNPMVILAREHMRQCGFSEEDVQRGSAMRTVDPERRARGEARAQSFVPAPALSTPPAVGIAAGTSRHGHVSVGWGPARPA